MLVDMCSGNQKGQKVFYTDHLAYAPTNYDEVKMDVQKGCGEKDTSGPLSSLNPPISVAASKPPSSNMNSRYFLPTQTPYFS